MSSDVPIGLPFNIASYALLTMMFAQCADMALGELIINSGDTHMYSSQIEPMRAMLTREELPLPTVKINPEVKDIFAFTMDDFELVNYQSHPAIVMSVAV